MREKKLRKISSAEPYKWYEMTVMVKYFQRKRPYSGFFVVT